MSDNTTPPTPARRIIGLTGGIGMGKTTVSNYLATTYQLPILDADIYARDAVLPGSPVLKEIGDRYGSGILFADGTLNRHRLGEIIFNSASERLWVEQQIHPYVRDRLSKERDLLVANHQLSSRPLVMVMVIPLLFEARMTDLVTETWVIACSSDLQIERLMQRDRFSLEEAQVRVNSQMAIQKKTAYADVILDNSSTLESLLNQVDQALLHPHPPSLTSTHQVGDR